MPIFVPVNFGQKCKAITLFFGQNRSKILFKFFHQKLAHFVPFNLGQKCKAIALLFGQKLHKNFFENFGPKIGPFLSRSILGKNARL